MPISVLIVDDHPIVRRGLRTFLENHEDIHVIGEAASGKEAIRLVEKWVPDVAIVDLIMPEMDGIEVIRRIRRISPRTQIIVLTSYYDDIHIFPAIKAGALSYLIKDVDLDNLVDTIHAAHQGHAILDPRVATRLISKIRHPSAEDMDFFAELTDREIEVLKLIAQGHNNAAIAKQLHLSEKTVKGYVSNILQKLHLADRTQAAVYAWKKGLMRSENA